MNIRYPERGGPGKPKYREGDEYDHPSGARYKRIRGNWVCIRLPDGTPVPEPER